MNAAFYRVVIDVLPDKFTFENRSKSSTDACQMNLFPQKELIHQRGISRKALTQHFAF